MNVIIAQTNNKDNHSAYSNEFVAIDEKGQRLAIIKWSVVEKKPKHKEIWVVSSHLYDGLTLDTPLKDLYDEHNRNTEYYRKDFSTTQERFEKLLK